jgi:osmotically-inducible protein OsmY
MKTRLVILPLLLVIAFSLACNRTSHASYKDAVERSLEQADLKDVRVAEDTGKNTITLNGTLHSEDAKQRAGQIAQTAAPGRIVANEISVEPVGNESAARKIESNVDDAIEKNYKAALISNGLDKQNIHFRSKNGVLTLEGRVKTTDLRHQAEQVASSVPNVAQVVNELKINR